MNEESIKQFIDNNVSVDRIFSVPFMRINIESLIDKKEIKTLIDHAADNSLITKSIGNSTTNNANLLDEYYSEFLLTKILESLVKNYFFLLGHNSLDIKIVQSWLNINQQKEFHHKHYHSNSYISGVLYLSSGINQGQFRIYRPSNQQLLQIPINNYNEFNFDHYFYEPVKYDVFLFPSSYSHDVSENNSIEPRISLAFNAFPFGVFGNNEANDLHIHNVSGVKRY